MLALTKVYKWSLLIIFTLVPLLSVFYLDAFQSPPLRFVDYTFHEIAILSSVFLGGFIAYVTMRCYFSSGEVFLRWLAIGLWGFAFIYAPHGFLTRTADYNIWFFLLYGPASRLVMSACFIVGLLNYGAEPHSVKQRANQLFWWKGIIFFIAIDIAIAIIANSSFAGSPFTRMSMEITALALSLISIMIILVRQIKSPLIVVYAIALGCFAQSSITFLNALVWTHLWWFAHVEFLAGFFLLSYGIVHVFHTTRSFSSVYSQEELMKNLREEKSKTENALEDLKQSHKEKENLISELKESVGKVKLLSGLIPICSYCKVIRDDEGYWKRIETYIEENSEAQFSHGICDSCMERLYGED